MVLIALQKLGFVLHSILFLKLVFHGGAQQSVLIIANVEKTEERKLFIVLLKPRLILDMAYQGRLLLWI